MKNTYLAKVGAYIGIPIPPRLCFHLKKQPPGTNIMIANSRLANVGAYIGIFRLGSKFLPSPSLKNCPQGYDHYFCDF
jgi:hypothetical protein